MIDCTIGEAQRLEGVNLTGGSRHRHAIAVPLHAVGRTAVQRDAKRGRGQFVDRLRLGTIQNDNRSKVLEEQVRRAARGIVGREHGSRNNIRRSVHNGGATGGLHRNRHMVATATFLEQAFHVVSAAGHQRNSSSQRNNRITSQRAAGDEVTRTAP